MPNIVMQNNKKYLEPGLNVAKMYDLYKEQCGNQQDKHVKESYYRFLFRTEFNMDFHVPKTDRSDHCEHTR